MRPVIYQLLVRTFGNTNETRKPNGSLTENGCGRFADINDRALASLANLGITHLWLTGVLEQASGTAYPNRPADPADLLKGIAGSPYAIRDCFDVSPDYATHPPRRLTEFADLIARCHAHRLKVLIDFVPNHVARSHASDIRPEESFGLHDDPSVFFDPNNHFFYLQPNHPGGGPPLKLPPPQSPAGHTRYHGEDVYGRVSGNNVLSWNPSPHDWFETAKLNYGHDFTTGPNTSHLPPPNAPRHAVPRTWRTMDEVLAHWQRLGVDGFRADMAHLIPLPFWRWAIRRARQRNPHTWFGAEAYDNDPAKLTTGNILDELLEAGFDAVYDDPSYDLLEGIYDGQKWANDIDAAPFTGPRFHQSLRYAENHDEVRLANPSVWGGTGMHVGRPVSATLFSLGQGPIMIYHGQEVGEPAIGAEGFCSDNARTSIFDYGSMPEFTKWVNGGRYDGARLSTTQLDLRAWYQQLLTVLRQPAFTQGTFHGLNHANAGNPHYGRLDGESASGHWLYSFLRYTHQPPQSFLVIVNFHPSLSITRASVCIPNEISAILPLEPGGTWHFKDHLASPWQAFAHPHTLATTGLPLPSLPPCSALMLEITRTP